MPEQFVDELIGYVELQTMEGGYHPDEVFIVDERKAGYDTERKNLSKFIKEALTFSEEETDWETTKKISNTRVRIVIETAEG